MLKKEDNLEKKIQKLLAKADSPLETREIETSLKSTRIMTLYRLHNLRGEGRIQGKQIGSGKGTWIWWQNNAFKKN